MVRAAVLIAATVAVVFGPILPVYWPTSDDFRKAEGTHLLMEHTASLGEALHALVFEAAGAGHFKPTQDVLVALAWEGFGPTGWPRAVMALYLGFHAASGILIVHILRRVGMDMTSAAAAGLLFVIHPAVDESLTCVLFGPNIPGLFGLLAASSIALRLRDEQRPGRRLLELAGIFGLLLFSMGSNLIFALAAPFVCGLVLVRRVHPRELRRLLVPYGVILGSGLSFAALRLSAQGTVGTAMPNYRKLEPRRDVDSALSFLQSIWDQGIRLEPSGTMDFVVSRMNSTAANLMLAARSTESTIPGGWILFLVGIVAVGLWSAGGRMGRVPQWRPLRSAFALGLVLFLACAIPYFLFLGRINFNRYLYPSLAGISILGVVTLSALLRIPFLAPTWRRPLFIFLVAVLAFPLLRESFSAVQSIRTAHIETARAMTHLANHIDTHRDIQVVGILDFPRAIGRSGYTYIFNGHVYAIFRVLARHRVVLPSQKSLAEALFAIAEGRLTPGQVAAFQYEPDGSLTQVSLEDLSADETRLRSLVAEHRAGWPHVWMGNLLRLPHSKIVETALQVLPRDEHYGRAALLEEVRELTRIAPIEEPIPVDAHAGLVANLGEALRQLVPLGRTPSVAADLQAALPGESLAALSRHWRDQPAAAALLLERAAMSPEDFEPKLRWEDIGMSDPGGPSLAARLTSERRARALAIDPSTARAALPGLDRARLGFHDLGIPRPDLSLLGLRTRLSLGWRPAKELPAWARERAPLALELAALAQAKDPWAVTVRTHVVLPSRAPIEVSVLVHILNEDERLLPGGVSSYAGRLTWRWQSEGGRVVDEVVTHFLPDDGVPGRRRRLIPCAIPLPARSGDYDLHLVLSAFGRTLVEAVVSEGVSVPDP